VGRPESIVDQTSVARGAAVMGIVNVTPDSFYDGGRYSELRAVEARIDTLLGEGADIIDVGGESTRPRSVPVPAAEQIARIEHALRYAVASGKALVSVDTTEPAVAEYALGLGAQIVNDVSCLLNPELARVTAAFGASLIIMHARGPMSGMPDFSSYPEQGYTDVVRDVRDAWRAAQARAVAAGMPEDRIWFDPGLGFNKSARHSLTLIARLSEFQNERVPIVVGPSRKSFIASVDAAPAEERLGGTVAACLSCVARGATVLRVHDVLAVRQALAVTRAVSSISPGDSTHA
jgi:dihydropteroate synthase